MANITDGQDLLRLLTDGDVASLDALTLNRTGGAAVAPQTLTMHKAWRVAGAAATAPVAMQWCSLWRMEGVPCHGAAPGAAANPTRSTAGAWQQANATGGRKLRFFSAVGAASAAGMLLLYDRLAHVSGLSGTVTTAQNLNGGSPMGITRYTSGDRVEIWAEIYTAIGATGTTISVSYANTAGASKTTQPVAIGATGRNEAGRIIRVSLASGDTGVQSATSATLAASTVTAGDFGITLARPLLQIPITIANGSGVAWWPMSPVPEIPADACLAWAWIGPSTTSPIFNLFAEILEV